MSNEEDAPVIAGINRILDVFEDTHGRVAQSVEEVNAWIATPKGKAALSRAGLYSLPSGAIFTVRLVEEEE